NQVQPALPRGPFALDDATYAGGGAPASSPDRSGRAGRGAPPVRQFVLAAGPVTAAGPWMACAKAESSATAILSPMTLAPLKTTARIWKISEIPQPMVLVRIIPKAETTARITEEVVLFPVTRATSNAAKFMFTPRCKVVMRLAPSRRVPGDGRPIGDDA